MSEVLDFEKQDGLIAAIVQDVKTRRVLMIGYMNREGVRENGYKRQSDVLQPLPGETLDQRRELRKPLDAQIYCGGLRWRRAAGRS